MNNREVDPDDDTLPDGQLVGQMVDDRFLIQKAIGKGGAGEVFLATDTRMLDRRVVVKVLLADWIGHGDVRRKFEHEKEALLRLDHPGIVSILDAGTLEHGQPYIVMPFVEGQTLQAYLKENSLPPLEICADIIGSTTDALSAAHSVGILHRDIKPANIMISFLPDKKLRVKIIDFGIARVFESKVSPITHIGRPLGTVLYVAPEQLLGHHEQTPAADVYSCGIMAYKMLTGTRPFEPQSMFEMAELHREGLKKLPSSIRPELGSAIDEILLKALAYSPDQRYQEISEFGRELSAALRSLPADRTASADVSQITRISEPNKDVGAPEVREPIVVDLGGTDELSVVTKHEASRRAPESQKERPFFGRIATTAGIAIIGTIALMIAGTAVGGMFFYQKWRPGTAAEPTTTAAAKVEYFFEVRSPDGSVTRRTRDDETLRNGYGFRVNISSSAPGRLYLFNENMNAGLRTAGGSSSVDPAKTVAEIQIPPQPDQVCQAARFYIMFPTAAQRKGVPDVTAGEQVATVFNTVTGPPGKEIVWLVWVKDALTPLEEARTDALRQGCVTNSATEKNLGEFLQANAIAPAGAQLDEKRSVMVLNGPGDVIVNRIELEHR